jgi:hypothetical protein
MGTNNITLRSLCLLRALCGKKTMQVRFCNTEIHRELIFSPIYHCTWCPLCVHSGYFTFNSLVSIGLTTRLRLRLVFPDQKKCPGFTVYQQNISNYTRILPGEIPSQTPLLKSRLND